MEATPPPDRGLFARVRAGVAWVMGAEGRFLRYRPGPSLRGRALQATQVLILALKRYRDDECGDRAAALTFTTLLSLVPLLLLALAVLGMLGLPEDRMEQVRGWLLQNFVPDTAAEMEGILRSTMSNLQRVSRGLGVLGLIALVMAGGKLLTSVSRTFRRLQGTTGGGGLEYALGFWSAIVLAPLLALVSITLTGMVDALAAMEGATVTLVGQVLGFLSALVPGWSAAFLGYVLLSLDRPRYRSAAVGGALTAVAWEVLKLGFALYLRQATVTRTMLSGLGVVPVFMVWLVAMWAAFLYGAQVTYAADDYEKTLARTDLARKDEDTGDADAPAEVPEPSDA